MTQLSILNQETEDGLNELTAGRREQLNVIHVPRRFVRNEWGGTETTILETCRALNARGHSSSVVTTTALCNQRQEEIRGVNIDRHKYVYPFFGLSSQDKRDMDKKGGNLLSLAMLRALLTRRDIDVLHAHTGKRLGGVVRTVARLRRIPYVISLHGGVLDVPEDEAQQLLEPLKGAFEWGRAFGALLGARRVLDDADAIICVGRNEQKAIKAQFPGKRVEWIPNGVDAASFADGNGRAFRQQHGIPRNRRVILNVGRIDPQKDQLALVDAMRDLLKTHRDAHLVLIGPVTIESYGARLLEKINDADLHNHVTVLPGMPGGSEELINAFHAADVFCLPSRHEPFGIVVLEAWAAGLPVVASRVGGIPSFTNDGENILHAEAGNPSSFSLAIDRLFSQPELAERIANNGRELACTRFDWAQITDRLESLYRDLVNG